MEIVPFKAEHILALQLQDEQAYSKPFITEEYAKWLEGEYAFTALVDGKPIAVAGVTELWANRALMWSFLGKDAGPHLLAIHKATLRAIKALPYRRLEADTPCDFVEGHRWLKMLGFKLEAERMEAYLPNGGDSSLYARVR